MGFVREWSRDLNAESGRPFIDRVVFFKVPSYHGTEAYKKAIRNRQVLIEPLLAEAKEWHGLRRPRLSGFLNANIQGLLIAAGAEPETHLGCAAWGDVMPSLWKPLGTFDRASAALGRLRVITDPAGD